MILRHTTHKLRLSSIFESGGLDANRNLRTRDGQFISFELNPPTDFLKNNMHLLKSNWTSWETDDTFSLDFDLNRIIDEGIVVYDPTSSGLNLTAFSDLYIGLKSLNEFIVWPPHSPINNPSNITNENIHSLVGEYRFVKDFLPLEYLTPDSDELLNSFIKR